MSSSNWWDSSPLLIAGGCAGYALLLSVFRAGTTEMNNPVETCLQCGAAAAIFAAHSYAIRESAGSAISTFAPESITGLSWLATFAQLAFSRHLYKSYVSGVAPRSHTSDLVNRVYIVTGANTGIGWETAKALLLRGATVIMACRSAQRAADARVSLIKATGVAEEKLKVLSLDLANFRSVYAFVEEFKKLGVPLHGLVNNAGLMMDKHTLTSDGQEMMMQANHLSHFLLTNLLLPYIKETKGRIVNLTSCVHNIAGAFNFDDITASKYYEMFYVYGQSKLANILFTRELQDRVKQDGVKVISVHPGCVRTEVTRNMAWWMQAGNRIFAPIMNLLQKSPAEGAYSSIFAVADPEVDRDEYDGAYIFHCRPIATSTHALDKEAAKRLWEVSEEITGLSSKKNQ